jgi:aromatic ring hydroxylase
MRTVQDYREGLKAMRPNIYMGGEVLDRDKIPGVEMMSVTFDVAHDPEL